MEINRVILDRTPLPDQFPTHTHSAAFMEAIGRAVATFGYLEWALKRAVFALEGTRPYPDDASAMHAFEKWEVSLPKLLVDQLGGLIDRYAGAIRRHPHATIPDQVLDRLLTDLRELKSLRNVLCHAFWQPMDAEGGSLPEFRAGEGDDLKEWTTAVDCRWLEQVRRSARDRVFTIMDTITHMGLQFPGTTGPGKRVWPPT